MARIWPPRRRRDRKGNPWVVAWLERNGARRHKTFGSNREAADTFFATKVLELGEPMPETLLPHDVSVTRFSEHWQRGSKAAWSPATLAAYTSHLQNHILPTIGDMRVRDVHQQHAIRLLVALLEKGYAEETVRAVYRCLRRLFQRAKFEGIRQDNPIAAIWRELPVSARTYSRRKTKEAAGAKAMTRSEVDAFIAAAGPDAAFFQVMYLAGLRIGEAIGLQLDDVDVLHGQLSVRRTVNAPRKGQSLEQRTGPVKNRESRQVDLGVDAVELLREQLLRRREENLRNGWQSPWLFVDKAGQPVDRWRMHYRMAAILRAAGLPLRFTPHAFRHSFATHLLSKGVPISWVAGQLGHSSPQVTLDYYWWALPSGDRTHARLLDSTTNRNQISAVAGDQRPEVTEPARENQSGQAKPITSEVGDGQKDGQTESPTVGDTPRHPYLKRNGDRS